MNCTEIDVPQQYVADLTSAVAPLTTALFEEASDVPHNPALGANRMRCFEFRQKTTETEHTVVLSVALAILSIPIQAVFFALD